MIMRKRIVVLTGAGISAESGIPTFRDADGLWEGYDVMEVATPEGWKKNPALVLDFYNQRRKAALQVKPNAGHQALVDLETDYEVVVITQNVDNLHERAGSSRVIHLHGSLFESRSTADESLVYDIDGWELKLGDVCKKGAQLRPNIVWFGEMVPMMEVAQREATRADIFMVIGTSLQVYPAAGLLYDVPEGIPIYIIDPSIPDYHPQPNITAIVEPASLGVPKVVQQLVEE
ncbi:SIR2 family NAD-dependent protein deacylase [Tunicatimonas pelagia]|uniref:SIR2 family NAD-dependent protein deacylase n=1 Tax=Tunicatimonas pelagia TaxID=931531 RepID=UPI00266543A0|nr:NAD-dependent deacylase [Tunicatimonas pelagia]WKN43088.1 NAD-dependent deacylase [Tunicatimonas pelagia]